MPGIRINANLFRIAHLCASTEETRYYLNGVFVTPHAVGGATLVATDGHMLVAIRDEHAECTAPEIIRTGDKPNDRAILKACTAPKRAAPDFQRSLIVDDNGAGRIETIEFDGATPKNVDIGACIVDGSFPDFTRIFPNGSASDRDGLPSFDAPKVKRLADLAIALCDHFDSYLMGSVPMNFCMANRSAPNLFRFGDAPAVALLMPTRDDTEKLDRLPEFVFAPPREIAA